MNVLFAASECIPFIKSGGLADVVAALPKVLKKANVDARVILPLFGQIADEFKDKMNLVRTFSFRLGWRKSHCGLFELLHDGIQYYFIDNEYYFKRDMHSGYYGHVDDGERFSYYCRAVLEVIPHLDFVPDIIHTHDWHTAMVGFLLKEQYQHLPLYKSIKNVFTIHNLSFQGVFPKSVMNELLMLEDKYFTPDLLEFNGNMSFMKGGLLAADRITTVSPTYKNEIQDEFFGCQLEGLLRSKSHKLVGIVNGIDTEIYHPDVDKYLALNYNLETIESKKLNKRQLQGEFNFEQNEDIPVVAMITRLSDQKGLDLVRHVFDEMMSNEVQFILLGTGEREYEEFFAEMEDAHRQKARAYIGFNEALAHRIYAGADMFLMPSLFEPCGLSQLISMAYGTVPIVRETGGLNDTVEAFNEFTKTGNGFSFANYNAHEMLCAFERALKLYNTDDWKKIISNAMKSDYSWCQSALAYKNVYYEALAE